VADNNSDYNLLTTPTAIGVSPLVIALVVGGVVIVGIVVAVIVIVKVKGGTQEEDIRE